MQDLQLCHGALFALKVALGVPVLYAVHLAVVVPDGLGALFEDVLFQQLLPCVAAIGAGEVEEASLTAPPAAIVRSLAVRGLDKDIVLFKQIDVGVVLQDAGLQVGDDVDAPGVHVLKELFRLREALVVPVEHIAQIVLFAAGVAGGQPEVVDEDALFFVLVDDLVDLLVAVLFQLGVVHGGGAVAQRLLGGQGAAAGQQGVLVEDLRQGGTGQQEQVDVAAVGLVVAVGQLYPQRGTDEGSVAKVQCCLHQDRHRKRKAEREEQDALCLAGQSEGRERLEASGGCQAAAGL